MPQRKYKNFLDHAVRVIKVHCFYYVWDVSLYSILFNWVEVLECHLMLDVSDWKDYVDDSVQTLESDVRKVHGTSSLSHS